MTRLRNTLGATDRARLSEYLEDIREIERRIQRVEAQNRSGEPRELPGAPVGVPDSFEEHIKLMFDLQAVAFASDITRVFAFKLGRDASNRVFADSGVTTGFHSASHHGDREERIAAFARINRYHMSMMPYFLDKLRRTPDGEGTLLDNTLVMYGSPMGNSNVHNHKRCPLFLAGHAGGQLKGGSAHQGGGRHPDGQRDAHDDANAGLGDRQIRGQHARNGSEPSPEYNPVTHYPALRRIARRSATSGADAPPYPGISLAQAGPRRSAS